MLNFRCKGVADIHGEGSERNNPGNFISAALWVPSWGNTQQYEFVVATGDVLEHFKSCKK